MPGSTYYNANIDEQGNLRVRNLIYNTGTLSWEAATGGSTPGSKVEITNFPTSQAVQEISGLVTEEYDHIGLGYTGSNLTSVVYKTGGSGGTVVATLTLGYDESDNLISVTRT